MPTYFAAIPLLHKDCKLFPYVPVVFDNNTTVRPIKTEHLGAIISKDRKMSESISARTKCITIASDGKSPSYSDVDEAAICGAFSLNVFAKVGSISCGQAFIIKLSKSHSVVDVISHSQRGEWSADSFAIDTTARPDAVKTLFSSTKNALKLDKKLGLTIRRFNAALTKSTPEDKIVDLAIALESIFNTQTEISYKFSLFNSWLSEADPLSRYSRYLLLKELYKKRSDIVHGNKALDVTWFEENWNECVKIAKLSLIGKIDFMNNNDHSDWQIYLDKLALGVVS